MSYRCISIPSCWLSSEKLDEYNSLVMKNLSSQSSGIFLSYFTHTGKFSYANSLFEDSIHEYICNSEDEFVTKINEIKLTNLLENSNDVLSN